MAMEIGRKFASNTSNKGQMAEQKVIRGHRLIDISGSLNASEVRVWNLLSLASVDQASSVDVCRI